MKRLTAIVLLLVVIFNLYGYRLVISCLQHHIQSSVETRIDQQDYSNADLVSVKTTLHLPYYNSSPEFERAYGSININGVNYEYVKRRVYNDTLELLCLPNHGKTKLQSASNALAKAAADGSASIPGKKATLKITLPDFFQFPSTGTDHTFLVVCTNYHPSSPGHPAAGYSLRQERPPQVNA